MQCPTCGADDTKVVDSRLAEQGAAIRRRRECLSCAFRFTTFERAESVPIQVVKSDGRCEPFDRSKVIAGVVAATKGREVSTEAVESLVDRVAAGLRGQGAQVSSASIGLAVLEQLRKVDDVAYLRFASVYKDFDAAADFHRELELLDKLSSGATSG